MKKNRNIVDCGMVKAQKKVDMEVAREVPRMESTVLAPAVEVKAHGRIRFSYLFCEAYLEIS